VRRGRE